MFKVNYGAVVMLAVGLELLIVGGLVTGNKINYPNFINVEVFLNSVSNTN